MLRVFRENAKPVMMLVLGGLGAYILYAGYLYLVQERLIFPGQGMPSTGDLRHFFQDAEYIELDDHAGGAKTLACYLGNPAARERGPVAIVAHGNAETIDDWADLAGKFHQAGLSLLLVEYPGYGRAQGRTCQTSIDRAFLRAYDWLAEHRAGRERIIVGLGRSIGSGPICELSKHRQIDGMILFSPFSSMAKMARPFGVPGFLLKVRYDNCRALEAFPGPVLIVHGENDRIIPAAHGQLLATAQPRARYVPLPAGHNDLWWQEQPLFTAVKSWLKANFP